MAVLAYKPEKAYSVRDKEKIYFSCHPQDFDLYFSAVCEEVFQTQDCVICYDAEPEVNWESKEDMEVELGRMQLFIIPITSRFLSQPNRSRNIEIPFALEQHIPILPLMQEPELEDKFDRVCGNLQFLDRNLSDLTAIPYQEKLKNFLSSVLLGDALAAEVRRAFAGYIFLSYRKKDRMYAQKLMRLIHRDEFCRDIAIWYDEFLVPGENYNNAIGDAIKKSLLFVMTVTPNMVNEKNYVMLSEYPKAIECGIKVLPVEMVKTKRSNLRIGYPGIRKAVKARCGFCFRWVLRRQIIATHHKKEELSSDALHLFLIGLAYLNGIDVEVDSERGVSLIEQAAKAGLLRAIDKLAKIYRNGIGVQRDVDMACYWQEKATEAYLCGYQKNKEEPDGIMYYTALYDLANDLAERGRVQQAEETYERLLAHSRELYGRFGSALTGDDLSLSLFRIGCHYYEEGKLAKARAACEEGLEVNSQLRTKFGEDKWRRKIVIVALILVGEVSQSEGDFRKARYCYEELLKEYQNDVEEKGTVDTYLDCAFAHHRAGRYCAVTGDMSAAEDHEQEELRIMALVKEKAQDIKDLHRLGYAYQDFGDMYQREHDFVKARVCYQKGLKIVKQEAEKAETIENRLRLCGILELIGDTHMMEENSLSAGAYYDRCLALLEELNAESSKVEIRRKLGKMYVKIGEIYNRENDAWHAINCFEKAVTILEKLSEETDMIEDYDNLAYAHFFLGAMDEEMPDFERVERALDIWKELTRRSPMDQKFQNLVRMATEVVEKQWRYHL